MSMNLHITANGEELYVYQTPTHITYMCMMSEDGTIADELKGEKARRAIAGYILWFKSRLDDVYQSEADRKGVSAAVYEHIDFIKSATKNIEAVEVFYL